VLFSMVSVVFECEEIFFVLFAFEIWHFGSENDILTLIVSLEVEKMDEKISSLKYISGSLII